MYDRIPVDPFAPGSISELFRDAALVSDFGTDTHALGVEVDHPAAIPSILPPNTQPVEAELEQFSARMTGIASPIYALWDPTTCPEPLLGYLAWALSVEVWGKEWSEENKRATLSGSIETHRRKGTIGGVRRALADAGYSPVTIIEGYQSENYDGSLTFDGTEEHDGADHWAEYRLEIGRPITSDQALELRNILANVAPARCHLKHLDFTEANNRYNAAITFNGAYTHGVV